MPSDSSLSGPPRKPRRHRVKKEISGDAVVLGGGKERRKDLEAARHACSRLHGQDPLGGVQSPQGKAEAPSEGSRSLSRSSPQPSAICIQETVERQRRQRERDQLHAGRWSQWELSSGFRLVRRINRPSGKNGFP